MERRGQPAAPSLLRCGIAQKSGLTGDLADGPLAAALALSRTYKKRIPREETRC
jgi:hypothetical protein